MVTLARYGAVWNCSGPHRQDAAMPTASTYRPSDPMAPPPPTGGGFPPVLLEAPYSVGFALWTARHSPDPDAPELTQLIEQALVTAQGHATTVLRQQILRAAGNPAGGLEIGSDLHERLEPKHGAQPADPNPRPHLHLIPADRMAVHPRGQRKSTPIELPRFDRRERDAIASEAMASWDIALRRVLSEGGLEVIATSNPPARWDLALMADEVTGLARYWCPPPGRPDQISPADPMAGPFANR